MVKLHDLATDGKSDSRSGARLVEPLEDREHLLGVARIDADAVVLHPEVPPLIGWTSTYPDARWPLGLAELQAIRDEVAEQEQEHAGISPDLGEVAVARHVGLGLADLELLVEHGAVDDGSDIYPLERGVAPDAAELEEIRYERATLLRGIDDEVEVFHGIAGELRGVVLLDEGRVGRDGA